MRKHVLLLAVIITGYNCFSQVRHVKGIDMWGIDIGRTLDDNIIGISWQYYFDRTLSMKTGGFYEYQKIPNFKYNYYGLKADLLYTLLSNKKNLYFNAIGGIISGMDNTKSEGISLDNKKLVVGQHLGLNIEFYLYHALKIDVGITQRIFQMKQNEKFGILYYAVIYMKL